MSCQEGRGAGVEGGGGGGREGRKEGSGVGGSGAEEGVREGGSEGVRREKVSEAVEEMWGGK